MGSKIVGCVSVTGLDSPSQPVSASSQQGRSIDDPASVAPPRPPGPAVGGIARPRRIGEHSMCEVHERGNANCLDEAICPFVPTLDNVGTACSAQRTCRPLDNQRASLSDDATTDSQDSSSSFTCTSLGSTRHCACALASCKGFLPQKKGGLSHGFYDPGDAAQCLPG